MSTLILSLVLGVQSYALPPGKNPCIDALIDKPRFHVERTPVGTHHALRMALVDIEIWTADRVRKVGKIPATAITWSANKVAVSPDGLRAAVSSSYGGKHSLSMYSLDPTKDAERVGEFLIEMGVGSGGPHILEVDHLAFSPDGKWLVTADRGGRVAAWDLDRGPDRRGRFTDYHDVFANSNWVRQVGFSSDGQNIVIETDAGVARRFKISSGRTLEWVETEKTN